MRLVLALSLSLVASQASATGIPVVDAFSNTQRMIEWGQQLEKFEREYRHWRSELDKLQRTGDALNGANSLADVFDNPLFQQYFPPEFTNFYNQIRSGGFEGLVRNGAVVRAATRIYENCEKITINDLRLECEANAAMPSQHLADAQDLYNTTVEHGAQLLELQSMVGTTETMKDSSDLNARILSEQTKIAGLSNQIETLNMVIEAQEKMSAQRSREFNARAFAAPKGTTLTPLDF